jgi:hypothetical protein
MTKDEALKMCLEYIETDAHERKYVRHAIKAALEAKDEAWECVCGANLYIDANGIPRSKSSVEPATVMFKPEQEAKDEPVQVSPLQFVEMVMEKEHLVGKPIFWAEWPNKEKNT